MAFVDLGDQFIALERAVGAGRRRATTGSSSTTRTKSSRRARDAGARMVGAHDFLDPWGNHWQVVDYRDVQFTKSTAVLQGMGLGELEKSERALAELRAKELAD